MTQLTDDDQNNSSNIPPTEGILTGDDPLLPSQDGIIHIEGTPGEWTPEEIHPVMIKIVDEQGDVITVFPGHKIGSIVESGEKHGVEIPVSCQAGACFTCAARVKHGMEDIDIWKVSVPLIDTDEDQILCCIAGIKDECFTDGKQHEIVLEKYI